MIRLLNIFLKNLNLWAQEIQDMIIKKNKSKWTADIVMEYKGRKLDPQKFNSMDQTQKYEMLLKLLNIIKIMKDHHVVHGDLHQ
jgi:RIO-like serine/threonine protein kinase